jgi:hypothetical protein
MTLIHPFMTKVARQMCIIIRNDAALREVLDTSTRDLDDIAGGIISSVQTMTRLLLPDLISI